MIESELTIRYMTLPLPHLTQTLSFDSDTETHEFLDTHKIATYIQPPAAPQTGPWKSIKPLPVVPLEQRVWDCKKAHGGCVAGMQKYRVVDLKGQVD
jgi:hypothetical protein